MKSIFITYGDSGYELAKAKLIAEAKKIEIFSTFISYGREQLSPILLSSSLINIKRGGGLWSWKPDIILSTMNICREGDIIVYCDAGCSVYPSKEWEKMLKVLEKSDIIAQRIFQKSKQWTRREIVDYFSTNGSNWLDQYQYLATVVILKVTDFSRDFVKEWRDLMISHPEFAMDVPEEKRVQQLRGFIENRHDQAIYSALIYKYLSNPNTKDLIYTQWEHIEDFDPIFKQAIRATRLRSGQEEPTKKRIVASIKRLIKDYIYKPFYYAPIQWWYSRKK